MQGPGLAPGQKPRSRDGAGLAENRVNSHQPPPGLSQGHTSSVQRWTEPHACAGSTSHPGLQPSYMQRFVPTQQAQTESRLNVRFKRMRVRSQCCVISQVTWC